MSFVICSLLVSHRLVVRDGIPLPIVVGATGEDIVAYNSGAAYVFHYDGADWVEQAILVGSETGYQDRFGTSVSIDGDAIVVGMSDYDDSEDEPGSTYVFRWNGTTWAEEVKLTASDAEDGDWFGIAVAISGDTIAVGASGDDDAASAAGAVYVFQWNGGSWVEEAKLTASDGQESDRLGVAVAISGNTIVAGADGDDDGGYAAGAAYVFQWDGDSWAEEAKLTASDADRYDYFGEAAAIVGDVIVVGAEENDDLGNRSGSAYVFHATPQGWIEQDKWIPSAGGDNLYFGISVAAHDRTVVVGESGKKI